MWNSGRSSEVSYKDNALLELDNDFAGDGRYYVYGYGRFQDSTTQISKAIILANDTYVQLMIIMLTQYGSVTGTPQHRLKDLV